MTEESEHTAGRNGTGGCAVAAACSLLYLSSPSLQPPISPPAGHLHASPIDRSRPAVLRVCRSSVVRPEQANNDVPLPAVVIAAPAARRPALLHLIHPTATLYPSSLVRPYLSLYAAETRNRRKDARARARGYIHGRPIRCPARSPTRNSYFWAVRTYGGAAGSELLGGRVYLRARIPSNLLRSYHLQAVHLFQGIQPLPAAFLHAADRLPSCIDLLPGKVNYFTVYRTTLLLQGCSSCICLYVRVD